MPFNRLAGQALNILPDRMNLFLRYMSGVGNEGLELDESTLRSVRRATEKTPVVSKEVDISDVPFEIRGALEEGVPVFKHTPTMGPGVPTSGAHGSYGSGDKKVTQTLGRFNAEVLDDGGVRITDTYDMENEFEDPDLVSGKFQPKKALLQLQSIYSPEARREMMRMTGKATVPPMDQRDYGQQLKDASMSDTRSPATALARAAMYLSPYKPKPFDIDVIIPPTTR
tara:strand:- start:11679 stop:12356 length:678 start_codon:yes stop_codon:yes gene_type:complete